MSDRVSIAQSSRLHFECGRSQREIARSLVLGAGTVSDYLKRARVVAQLDWATASTLSGYFVKQSGRRETAPRLISRRYIKS